MYYLKMGTAKDSLSKPFRKFLVENSRGGRRLLEALYWEALNQRKFGQPAELDLLAESVGDLRLDHLVDTAAKEAARRDPERPLDQQRARRRYFKLFEELKTAGWGKVIVGRRGSPTRFVFHERFAARDLDRVFEAIGIERRSFEKHESSPRAPVPVKLDPATQPGSEGTLRRDNVVALLRANAETIHGLGVSALSLFGSLARDEARLDSDIDLLVAFDGSITSDRFFDAKFFLEDLLGTRIDLVTEAALRERVRRAIEPELIRVA